ncbi:unnamed protein product [Camellia sinensis]
MLSHRNSVRAQLHFESHSLRVSQDRLCSGKLHLDSASLRRHTMITALLTSHTQLK